VYANDEVPTTLTQQFITTGFFSYDNLFYFILRGSCNYILCYASTMIILQIMSATLTIKIVHELNNVDNTKVLWYNSKLHKCIAVFAVLFIKGTQA
jgi:hypothetical protein